MQVITALSLAIHSYSYRVTITYRTICNTAVASVDCAADLSIVAVAVITTLYHTVANEAWAVWRTQSHNYTHSKARIIRMCTFPEIDQFCYVYVALDIIDSIQKSINHT